MVKREVWLQFESKEAFLKQEQMLYGILHDSDGNDEVVIYCKKEHIIKHLAKNRSVEAGEVLLSRLTNYLGESCVKVIEKPIENLL